MNRLIYVFFITTGILSLILFNSLAVKAQMTPDAQNIYADSILTQAKRFANAIIEKDYDMQIKTIYPRSIDMVSEVKNNIEVLKKEDKRRELDGTKYKSINFKRLSKIIDFNGELQCTILKDVEFSNRKKFETSLSTVICISKDMGKTWFFIDTLDKGQKIFNDFQNLSKKLTITEGITIETTGKL